MFAEKPEFADKKGSRAKFGTENPPYESKHHMKILINLNKNK